MRYFTISGVVVGLILIAGCMPNTNMGRTGVGGLAVGDRAPAIQIDRFGRCDSKGCSASGCWRSSGGRCLSFWTC